MILSMNAFKKGYASECFKKSMKIRALQTKNFG